MEIKVGYFYKTLGPPFKLNKIIKILSNENKHIIYTYLETDWTTSQLVLNITPNSLVLLKGYNTKLWKVLNG